MKQSILFCCFLLSAFAMNSLAAQSCCTPAPACKAVCSPKPECTAAADVKPKAAPTARMVSNTVKVPMNASANTGYDPLSCDPTNCVPANCNPKNCEPTQCDISKCKPAATTAVKANRRSI
jgi:hypothetical protein